MWGIQLLCPIFKPTAVQERRKILASRTPSSSIIASPPDRPCRRRWGSRHIVAGRMLGRCGKERHHCRMCIRYSRVPPSPAHSRMAHHSMNACHALRNAQWAAMLHAQYGGNSDWGKPHYASQAEPVLHSYGIPGLAGPWGGGTLKRPRWRPHARITCKTRLLVSATLSPTTRRRFFDRKRAWQN